MSVPSTCAGFLECLRKSGLVDNQRLDEYLRQQPAATESVRSLAMLLVRDGFLTAFQAEQVRLGRWRNFFIQGKYKVLERLGSGATATVFLCEHTTMRRPVALKVLPSRLAASPGTLQRFLREARIAAQLEHPNLVSAFDVDQSGGMHYLVMEYIDGTNLHQLVKSFGPLHFVRAAHYIRQAAEGLQFAHERGLVHRDIKPGNILLHRSGTIKVLDMGLARFFHEEDDLTRRHHPKAVLGTADFLSPEQALDSHSADIRSDIYSLGITFYFLLTGVTPFEGATTAQKLLWHQVREPRPVRSLRPDVPEEMAAVLETMTAKAPDQRYQVPAEVALALVPWTNLGLVPPSEEEMPQHVPVLRGLCRQDAAARRSFVPNLTAGPPEPSSSIVSSALPPPDLGRSAAQETAAPDTAIAAVAEGSTIIQGPPATQAPPTLLLAPEPAEVSEPPASVPRRVSPRARRLVIAAIAAPLIVAATVVVLVMLLSGPTRTNSTTAPSTPSSGPARTRAEVTATSPARQVVVSRDGDNYRVQGRAYVAVVDADGYLVNLQAHGVELLENGPELRGAQPPGKPSFRGSYLYDQGGGSGVLKLAGARQVEDSIQAESALAALEHHFAADTLIWKLDNRTDHELRYYIIFSSNVLAVCNDRGELARAPAEKEWSETSWFAGPAKLTLSGGTKIWGPWMNKYQVWQVTLAARQTRRVTATIGTASATELARIGALSPRPRP
jgi:serine/threonine protein kinase